MKMNKSIVVGRMCTKGEVLDRIHHAREDPDITEMGIFDIELDENVGEAVIGLLLHPARAGNQRCWKSINIARCRGGLIGKVVATAMTLQNLEKLSLEGIPIEQLEPYLPRRLDEAGFFSTSLRELCLRRCQICKHTAYIIAASLCQNPNIRSLDLSSCTVAEDGAISVLAQGMKENSYLRSLSLFECRLHDAQMEIVLRSLEEHPSLEDLNIGNNECGESAMASLAKVLRSDASNIAKLDMSLCCGCRPDISILAPVLSKNVSLNFLGLSFNSLQDNDMALLAHALSENSSLQSMDLESNGITDLGIRSFANLVPQMKGLKRIQLLDNPSSQEGGLAIVQALRKNMMLEDIGMGGQMHSSLKLLQEMDYYLDLNWGGRRLMAQHDLPVGLFPIVIERAGIKGAGLGHNQLDIINYMIRGSALFERG